MGANAKVNSKKKDLPTAEKDVSNKESAMEKSPSDDLVMSLAQNQDRRGSAPPTGMNELEVFEVEILLKGGWVPANESNDIRVPVQLLVPKTGI